MEREPTVEEDKLFRLLAEYEQRVNLYKLWTDRGTCTFIFDPWNDGAIKARAYIRNLEKEIRLLQERIGDYTNLNGDTWEPSEFEDC
jgi:hypothetical protein